MRVGSLFSGVGGLDLGLARAGFTHQFFCEADPYRRRVLSRHWPGVPVYEDVSTLRACTNPDAGRDGGGVVCRAGSCECPPPPDREQGAAVGGVDLLAGGFPCQDLSVAGKRKGLAGERSGLFFEFARIADELVRPGGWVLVENVPGLLSSNGGRDMGIVVTTLADLGFLDLAYRVLDSRYLGVPQRRRRVFILARRAGGQRAVQVLLEPESGGGDFEASREARQGTAGSVEGGVARTLKADGGISIKGADHDTYIAESAKTLTASERWDAETEDFICPPPHPNGVRTPPRAPGHVDDPDWPNPRPDGPRYSACGDAVTANVAEWIGRRLMERA